MALSEYKENELLALCLVEMIAQNQIYQLGLREFPLLGASSHELLVVVRNCDELIVLWKGPTTHTAVELTATTRTAFEIVALLAERLPVLHVVRTPSRPGAPMVRAQLNFRFLFPAMSTWSARSFVPLDELV
jgi:hypothetical protein